MNAVVRIYSLSFLLVLFYTLSAERLSSQSHQVPFMTGEVSVFISGRGNVHIRCKDTGRFNQLPNAKNIFNETTHISLESLLAIGSVFSEEDFKNSVPKEFKRFYMADEDGNFLLTIGGFLASGGDYSFLSPEQAAQEELIRERADGMPLYMPLIRCSSPVHLLKP